MLEWIYPPRCPVCFEPVMPKGALLHTDCEVQLEFVKEPICKKCGRPVSSEEEEYCAECNTVDRGWEIGRSVFLYRGIAGNALRRVKNEGTEEFVRFFAAQVKRSQGKFIRQWKPDCIVPVPLHPSRQRRRGFNQAELLANALGRELGIPVRLLLKKHKKTKDQKNLSRNQRRKNVKDAFCVAADMLAGGIPCSVLLLDDVSTTGSTLSACAIVLKAAGVKRVAFLSICAGEQID